VRDFDLDCSAYERLIGTINEMNQISIRHAEKLPPIVFVIDDDASMRAALSSLIRSVGLRVEVFASGPDFLATKAQRTDGPSCLILDVRLPGVSGLDFQAELATANSVIPIIFITGHGDIPMSVKAMKGWCCRVPDQAVSGPGPLGCRSGGTRARNIRTYKR
jgi:CheY-like chemotaxis protein